MKVCRLYAAHLHSNREQFLVFHASPTNAQIIGFVGITVLLPPETGHYFRNSLLGFRLLRNSFKSPTLSVSLLSWWRLTQEDNGVSYSQRTETIPPGFIVKVSLIGYTNLVYTGIVFLEEVERSTLNAEKQKNPHQPKYSEPVSRHWHLQLMPLLKSTGYMLQGNLLLRKQLLACYPH